MTVTVIMATRNGAAHLGAQLDSLRAQRVPWQLMASDDGSSDGTALMLRRFVRDHGDHGGQVVAGPEQGLAGANFLAALRHPDLRPGPVAFADQDDIWRPHRLSDGLEALENVRGPAIACAPVQPVDARGRMLGAPLAMSEPQFENALVQNVLCGSAITLNAAAVAALRADPAPPPLPFHDWYITLRATAAGWPIRITERPGVLYRQHGGNLLGQSRGLRRRARQVCELWDGTWAAWRNAGLDALLALPDGRIRPEARAQATTLRYGTARGQAWRVSGARRQNALEQALLRGFAGLARV